MSGILLLAQLLAILDMQTAPAYVSITSILE